jgi:phosphoadenosine phosphosulfate reductase
MTSLVESTLFGVRDKVTDAIERIRGYAPLAGHGGYRLAFSGGKDSVVILELCKMAGVKFEAHHSLTTIDPPELVQFIRNTPGVIIDRPEKSFFELLITHGFPLRHKRWCCAKLKEGGGKGRLVITGVRWE